MFVASDSIRLIKFCMRFLRLLRHFHLQLFQLSQLSHINFCSVTDGCVYFSFFYSPASDAGIASFILRDTVPLFFVLCYERQLGDSHIIFVLTVLTFLTVSHPKRSIRSIRSYIFFALSALFALSPFKVQIVQCLFYFLRTLCSKIQR